MNGMLDFVELDAVAVHQTGDHRQAIGHPAIGLRAGRPAVYRNHELVNIGLTAAPEIIA